MARAFSIACLAHSSTASVANTFEKANRIGLPRRTATFGTDSASRSEQAMGNITFDVSRNSTYTAIEWNTQNISIPVDLVKSVCGSTDADESPTFMYAIHDTWDHRHGRSAQGRDGCSTHYVGKRWDPTAACSEYSNNAACDFCNTKSDYSCSPETFDAAPDASGSFAYRFLNSDACELGDLSGMHGELTAPGARDDDHDCRDSSPQCQDWADMSQCDDNPDWMLANCKVSCGVCQDTASRQYFAFKDLTNDTAGFAQMSSPFGTVKEDSVDTNLIGTNCDSFGPPIAHATNCGCIRDRHHADHASAVGSITVFGSFPFYLADSLRQLDGKSLVVSCGSVYGDNAGEPLFCAKIQ